MTGTAPGQTTSDWSHETVIRDGSPRAMARAFVSTTLGLGGHGLFHLVDIVQLVACELAADATARGDRPVTLKMSKTSDVVRLEVHEAAGPEATARVPSGPAAQHGSRFIELLSLQWGSTSDAETHSVWVAFDARPVQHAVHTARRASDFTRGHAPGLEGEHHVVQRS